MTQYYQLLSHCYKFLINSNREASFEEIVCDAYFRFSPYHSAVLAQLYFKPFRNSTFRHLATELPYPKGGSRLCRTKDARSVNSFFLVLTSTITRIDSLHPRIGNWTAQLQSPTRRRDLCGWPCLLEKLAVLQIATFRNA
jgi:hypothetical protein